jgi:hypothetical protein
MQDFLQHIPSKDSAPGAPPFTRQDVGPLALLAACMTALFWRVLFTPAMFFYRDVFNYSYPHAKFIQEICRQGQLPYWNPFLNYGEPVLANPNFLFFYPSTLLLILLPIDLAYTLHYVLHFALAAAGTYGLARRWGQNRFAAFFAGFIFGFSGPLLSLGNLYNHAAAAAWIPWALLLTDMALARASRRCWVLLTFVFALQFLASEPFTLIATFILCLAYALFQRGDLHRPLAAANLRIVITFAIVGALFVALSAVQLLPSLSLLSNSRRGVEGLPFKETTSWSFHPLMLLEFVVPGFFGPAIDSPTLWTSVLSTYNMPYYCSVFVGFIPLFFAFVGAVRGGDRRRKFTGFAVIALLVLSFGRFTPAFALVYLLFPPLALVRFPAKLLILMLALVALLAGWGLDGLSRDSADWKDQRKWLVRPLAILAGIIALTWLTALLFPRPIESFAGWVLLRTNRMFIRSAAGELTADQVQWALRYFTRMLLVHLPGLAGFTLGGLLLIEGRVRNLPWARRAVPAVALLGLANLAWVNQSANPVVPKTFYTYRPPVLAQFDLAGRPYRVAYVFHESENAPPTPPSQAFVNFDSIPEARDLPPLAQFPFRDRLILARATLLLDTESIANIDVERSFPIYLYDFWVFALKGLRDPARTACLLGRTNVRYEVLPSREAAAPSTQREVASISNGSPDPHYLFENRCATPRAFAASRATTSPSVREMFTRLSDPAFNPRSEVFLSSAAQRPSGPDSSLAPGEVELVRHEPNSVILRARLARPGYVVLLDRFDPNWHASLDGQEVEIYRANGLFRAVSCPAGEHELRFNYRQKGLRAGLVISLAALTLLAVLCVTGGNRKDNQG